MFFFFFFLKIAWYVQKIKAVKEKKETIPKFLVDVKKKQSCMKTFLTSLRRWFGSCNFPIVVVNGDSKSFSVHHVIPEVIYCVWLNVTLTRVPLT